MHLIGFIRRIYHDARPHERQFIITMRGHLNVNLSRCAVTWTSIYHDAWPPERQFIMMHGHLNVNLSRCTITWTSIYHDARSPERQFITMHGHLNVNFSRCTVTWTSKTLRVLNLWHISPDTSIQQIYRANLTVPVRPPAPLQRGCCVRTVTDSHALHNREIGPTLVLFHSEGWFHITGCVNSRVAGADLQKFP